MIGGGTLKLDERMHIAGASNPEWVAVVSQGWQPLEGDRNPGSSSVGAAVGLKMPQRTNDWEIKGSPSRDGLLAVAPTGLKGTGYRRSLQGLPPLANDGHPFGVKKEIRGCPAVSGQHTRNGFRTAGDARQPLGAAVVLEIEFFGMNPKSCQNRGVKIMDAIRVLFGSQADVVGGADLLAAPDAGA